MPLVSTGGFFLKINPLNYISLMKRFDFSEFGIAVTHYLFHTGCTLTEMASKTGISKSTCSRLANGVAHNTTVDNILSICDWMKSNITDFIIKTPENGKSKKNKN